MVFNFLISVIVPVFNCDFLSGFLIIGCSVFILIYRIIDFKYLLIISPGTLRSRFAAIIYIVGVRSSITQLGNLFDANFTLDFLSFNVIIICRLSHNTSCVYKIIVYTVAVLVIRRSDLRTVQADLGNQLTVQLRNFNFILVQIDCHRCKLIPKISPFIGVLFGIDGNGRDSLCIDSGDSIQNHPVVIPASQLAVGAACTYITLIKITMVDCTAGSSCWFPILSAVNLHTMNGDFAVSPCLLSNKFFHLANAIDMELGIVQIFWRC